LVGWLVCQLVSHSVDWLVSWSVSQLVGVSVCQFVSQLVGWSVGQSVSQLVGWLVCQLVSWSVGWFFSWSVGQSVGLPVSLSDFHCSVGGHDIKCFPIPALMFVSVCLYSSFQILISKMYFLYLCKMTSTQYQMFSYDSFQILISIFLFFVSLQNVPRVTHLLGIVS